MGNNLAFNAFNTAVRPGSTGREDSYVNAPAYYALTGRHGLTLHEGYGGAVVVCEHPNVAGRLLVFPEIQHQSGGQTGRLTASVLGRMDPPPGGVQLARYSESDLSALREAFAQQNHKLIDGLRVMEEEVLDWRYPAHILDTAHVAGMEGGDFMKLRNKVKRAEADTQILPLQDPQALRAMRAAYKYWEGSMVMRGHTGAEESDFYPALFAMIEKHPDQFNGLVFLQGKRPVGFTVYDRPYLKTVNLLANLSDAMVTGLADYQVVATCRALAATGIPFMNFGGSETQTLDLYKRKFMPVKSVGLLSAEVVYAAPVDTNVRSVRVDLG